MDEGGTTTKTGIYCRGCDYDLRESALRCPECGRTFDTANPKTYFTSPRTRRVRKWIRRVVLLILLVTLPPGTGLGWLWWGWKAEQGHIAALKQAGCEVTASEPLYPWLSRILPERWMFLAYRADSVYDARWLPASESQPQPQEAVQHIIHLRCLRELAIRQMRMTDQDVHQLRGLPRLERIILNGPGITDQALADLAGMKRVEAMILIDTVIAGPGLRQLIAMPRLQRLTLIGASIGDAALVSIGEMKQLQSLGLSRTRITDAGVTRLAGLTQLRVLSLTETKVGDDGLKCLAGMTALVELFLDDTAVTDVGLEHLKGLAKLQYLGLHRVRISPDAQRRLQTALPQTFILRDP